MRAFLVVISLTILFQPNAFAQQNLAEKLKAGTDAIRMYNLPLANKLLAEVLQHKNELNDAQLGEALYFYSRSQYQLFIEKANENEENLAKLEQQQLAYKAYNLLLELNNVNNQRWSSKAEVQMRSMCNGLYRGAIISLDLYFKSNENPNLLYKSLAQGYISLAQTIDPVNYISQELKGQLYYFEKDSANAAYYFDECLALYKTHRLNQEANVRIGDVYQKRARMFFNSGLNDSALTLVNDGIIITKFEESAVTGQLGIKYSKEEVNYSKELASNILLELELLQLEIYANTPEQYEKGNELFLEQESKFEDNPRFALYYGQLLEVKKPFMALEQYTKAAELDTTSFEAQFYAGALYFALASDYREEALKTTDNKTKKAYFDNSFKLFSKGYVYMRKAHNLKPENQYVIMPLFQAAKILQYNKELAYLRKIMN